MRVSFLCHGRRYDNPFTRCKDELQALGIELTTHLIPCSNDSRPSLWPTVSEGEELARQSAVSAVIDQAMVSKPDLILVHHDCLTKELMLSDFKLIVDEQNDRADLGISRYFIHRDNIKLVLKQAVFKDRLIYNADTCEGMYQNRFINLYGLPLEQCERPVSEEHLEKIICGFSLAAHSQNKRLIDRFSTTRKRLVMSFIGRVDYSEKSISYHRHIAMRFGARYGTGLFDRVSQEYYDEIMAATYCSLCPFGNGLTLRPFEAMYNGSLPVMPSMEFMETWPDIYQKGRYVQCAPDFIDVKDVCFQLRNDWKNYQSILKDNRNHLMQVWNNKLVAKRIKEMLESVV